METVEIKVKVNKRNQVFKFIRSNTERKPCTSVCPYSDICESLINPYTPEDKNTAEIMKDTDFGIFCSCDAPDLLGISRSEFREFIPEEGSLKVAALKRRD